MFVSQSVRVYVSSSIFGNSARTAGPIGTGVAPFDASKRRNDDGACHGSIGGTWHIPPREAFKKNCGPLEVKQGDPPKPNLQVTCMVP